MFEMDFQWWWVLVVMLYGVFMLFVLLYSVAQLDMLWHYTHRRPSVVPSPLANNELPYVTIQLPIYNERYVVERLLDAIAQMDYPIGRWCVQVLDDSTDDTSSLIQARMVDMLESGIDIEHVRRPFRDGYKAGALAWAMDRVKGEFVVFFDADFVPPSDFLRTTVPAFADSKVGVVQTRWAHLNKDFNWLTKLQAFGLDAHFTVEQGGRAAAGCFIHFNGTAGVWRKAAIVDAGGWSSDTLTEDLDLSYRAQLKGWEIKYREDLGTPAELPIEINALKTQQYRWTKGAAECTRKLLPLVWQRSDLGFRVKLHAMFHLMNAVVFISVFVTAVLSIPLFFMQLASSSGAIVQWAGSLLWLSMLFLASFYWVAFRRASPTSCLRDFVFQFVGFLVMTMGLSIHNAIAVAEGFLGRKTPFMRTPKFNTTNNKMGWRANKYRNVRFPALSLVELIMGCVFAGMVWLGLEQHHYGLIHFHLMLSIGYLSVGGLTIWQSFR